MKTKTFTQFCIISLLGFLLTAAYPFINYSGWHWPLPKGKWSIAQGPMDQYPNGCHSHCDGKWVNIQAVDIDDSLWNKPYILAPADGTVKYVGDNGSTCGLVVKVYHPNSGMFSVFCHLDSSLVSQGQEVILGDRLGVMGSSGSGRARDNNGNPMYFGTHLHFTITKEIAGSPVSLVGLENYQLEDTNINSGNKEDNSSSPIDEPIVIGNPPASPQLSSPMNGKNFENNTKITFSWTPSSSATSYFLEYWGGPYTGSLNSDWKNSTSFSPGTLWPGSYTWHVKARNTNGTSDWSSSFSFIVEEENITSPSTTPQENSQEPDAPTLRKPVNSKTLSKQDDIWFSWNEVSNATEYYLEYWGGPYEKLNSGWINDTAYHIGSMWPGTMSWHVKARSTSGQESEWSDTWSFTVEEETESQATPTSSTPTVSAQSSVEKPILSKPANSSSWSKSTEIKLTWEAVSGADEYKVELWGGPYDTMTPCDWQSRKSCYIGIMWPGTMSWHVKARSSSGQESEWSDTWSFTVEEETKSESTPTSSTPTSTAQSSINAPNLSNPENSSSWAQSTEIKLTWQSVSGANVYKVELWGGPYDTMTPCDWQSSKSCFIGTMWPGTMSWHVKARNASGQESEWSETRSFTIQEISPTATTKSEPGFVELVDNLSLRADPSGSWPPIAGDKLIAHIKIKNGGDTSIHILHIGVRGRRNGSESWDIGFWEIDVNGHQEWSLDPNNERPLQPGSYSFKISYSIDGSSWVEIGNEINFTVN